MTVLFMTGSNYLYGFGFLIGSAIFCLVALIRLSVYISKLKYHVLSKQPIFAREVDGVFTRLCDRLEIRALRKQRSRRKYFEKGQN